MQTFFFPVEGLTVEVAWDVGPVEIRPGAEALTDLRTSIQNDQALSVADEMFADHGTGAIAQVDASDRDDALALVGAAVDVLRVYQHVRHWQYPIGQFGLAGDLGQGALIYGQIGGDRAGTGWMHRGDRLGWTFSATEDWSAEATFRQVAAAIGRASPTEGERRALVGAHYLSRAIADHRAPFRMVALVTALEAMLLPRRGRSQTFKLARAISYFGCGRHDGNLCGRSRDTCPYLGLDPDLNADRRQLVRLRTDGAEPPWLCSEWHRVVDWYELRSDVVHGAGPHIDSKDASNALYWVIKHLTEPILEWLMMHPVDPTAELELAIGSLPTTPDWEARLGPLGAPRTD